MVAGHDFFLLIRGRGASYSAVPGNSQLGAGLSDGPLLGLALRRARRRQ